MSQAPAGRARFAYVDPGPAARIRPAWTAPLILLLIAGAAMAAIIVLMLGVVALSEARGRPLPPDLTQRWWAGVGMSLALFAAWAGLAALWVRRGERRPLASAGLAAFHLPELRWWPAGAAWSVVLVLILSTVGGETFGERPSFPRGVDWTQAATVIVCSLAVVAVLATAEEVVFRGWLLSSLAARLGTGWALAATSVLFGAAHVFPHEWGDPARLLSFVSFAATGVAFGCVALGQGSVWSAAAFHAGYNSVLVLLSAASAGFQPQALWSSAADTQSGVNDMRGAVVLAAAACTLAAAAVSLWLRRSRALSPPLSAAFE